MILKVAVPRCLGPVRDTNLRERPARKVPRPTFDLSRGRARGARAVDQDGPRPTPRRLRHEAAAAPPMATPVRQRLGLSQPSRLGPNAASRVVRSAYAAWTVNLFSQGRVI
jgi:hypothetical protein